MKTQHLFASTCRFCRYYKHEGRRGGMCHQLNAPVQGSWKTCSLAIAPFSLPWNGLEEIRMLENSLSLNCSADCGSLEASENKLPSSV